MAEPEPTANPTLLDTLQLMATDAPLEQQLASICHLIEEERAACCASILVLEGTRLRHGAAPGLDPDYCRMVDGVEIGPAVGSCGTAAHTGQTVISTDIASDPRWAGLADAVIAQGFAACWSEPILDSDGAVLGTFGTYCRRRGGPDEADRDALRRAADIARIVLERDRRQRELHETRGWLDLALDAAGAGLWDLDVASGRVTVSPSFLSLLGLEDADASPDLDWLLDLIHPDDRQSTIDTAMRQVMDPLGRLDLSFRLRMADGSHCWMHGTGRVVGRQSDGKPVRVIGQHVDDTPRRQAEQRERELAERLLKISSTAPAMLYQMRIDGEGRTCVPFVSDAVQPLFGLTPAEIADDADAIFRQVHPDDRDGVWTAIRRSHARMEPWRHEFRVLAARRDGNEPGPDEGTDADGSRWLLGHATPERGPAGSVVWHGYMSDITDQKTLEERLIRASELAAESSRAKSAFITNLSHELRTPLTSILGFVDLMDQGVVGDDEQSRREAIGTIRRNGGSLLEIIDHMLELARIESRSMALERIAIDPRHVVDEVVEAVREQAETKGLRVDVVHDSAVPELVETDPQRLRQILGQLLDNAVKFTPDGGVRVRLAVVAAEDGSARLSIAVQDTGIGMSEPELASAFEAFTQADASLTREHGGAGLGLRIARSLTRMLGGDLRAESQSGAGSTFTVLLALAGERSHGSAPVGPPDRRRPDRTWSRDTRDIRATQDLIAAMDVASPSDFDEPDAGDDEVHGAESS